MKKLAFVFSLLLSATFSFSQSAYIGQWRSSDTTELVEITADSILIYEIDEGCYNLTNLAYLDIGNDSLILSTPVGNLPAVYSLSNNDSVLTMFSLYDTSVYYSYSFDISQIEPCNDDSTAASQNSYLGQWQTTSPSLMYVNFTSDSILIYTFDSTQCYSYNSLVYSDIGNNQLQIAVVITSTYSFSNNGNTMSINITGLGDLELQKDTFDASEWVKCTWEWQCATTGCENVGNGNGTFNSQADCQSSCADTLSVGEYDLDVLIYPNPFNDYTTLSLSSSVISYQLLDITGRRIYGKLVESPKERVYRNNLKSGIYLLQLVGERGSHFERLIIQ